MVSARSSHATQWRGNRNGGYLGLGVRVPLVP
jgi:hypothetical protein